MGLLKVDELVKVRDAAVAAGLAARREALVAWFAPAIQANLPGSGPGLPPASALALDLNFLNQLTEPSEDGVFLTLWLKQAAANSPGRPATQKLFGEMAELAARRAAEMVGLIATAPASVVAPAATAASVNDLAVPEKILFRSTLLPNSFIALAGLRAASVARLSVPKIAGGVHQTNAAGDAAGVYGTGWLIGPQHLLTNWHVVRARSSGEADPPAADVEAQAAAMKVEFDYVDENVPAIVAPVEALVHGDPALDYALVKLATPSNRAPLPLRAAEIDVDANDPLAANVIQHPGGAVRQFAIRNNLAALRQGNELAYFTDTAGGSSGSPVFNDAWQVIALHKASSVKFGDFSFQGKSTTWVNVGMVITAIVTDLQNKMQGQWPALGAVMA